MTTTQRACTAERYTLTTYTQTLTHLLAHLPNQAMLDACDVLETAYQQQRSVFVCGNGGSCANASHFTEDLAKLMWQEHTGKRLRVHSLGDSTPYMTALANDDGYDRVFEIQLAIAASKQDVLLCISGSGNSPNVLRAASWAREHGLSTIGLTGYDAGKLGNMVDVHMHIPCDNMGMLECVHMVLLDFISKELRFRAYGIPHPNR